MKNLVALEALAFVSATYKIKKSRLSQLYFNNDIDFDWVIKVQPMKS